MFPFSLGSSNSILIRRVQKFFNIDNEFFKHGLLSQEDTQAALSNVFNTGTEFFNQWVVLQRIDAQPSLSCAELKPLDRSFKCRDKIQLIWAMHFLSNGSSSQGEMPRFNGMKILLNPFLQNSGKAFYIITQERHFQSILRKKILQDSKVLI